MTLPDAWYEPPERPEVDVQADCDECGEPATTTMYGLPMCTPCAKSEATDRTNPYA